MKIPFWKGLYSSVQNHDKVETIQVMMALFHATTKTTMQQQQKTTKKSKIAVIYLKYVYDTFDHPFILCLNRGTCTCKCSLFCHVALIVIIYYHNYQNRVPCEQTPDWIIWAGEDTMLGSLHWPAEFFSSSPGAC